MWQQIKSLMRQLSWGTETMTPIGFLKPWTQTNTWRYPSRTRDLMYSTGRDSSGSQSSFFDPIALSCFVGVLQAFCKKTNVSGQHIVQVCVLPSGRVPGNHQRDRQKGKQNRRNSVCPNSKTQSVGLVTWWKSCTSAAVRVTGQGWNLCAVRAQLSSPLWSALQIAYWEVFDGSAIREVEGSASGTINGMDITSDGVYFVTGEWVDETRKRRSF